MPVDGERDGRIAQHAEVEGVVGVLPDVFAADHGSFAKGLLQAGMELVAKTGIKRTRNARCAGKQRRQHRVRTTAAGEHKVLIERRFQGARIGDAADTVLVGLML